MTAQQLGDRVRIHGDDGTVLSLEDRHILQMVADSGAIWVRPGLPVEVPSEYVIQWVDGHRKLTVQLPPGYIIRSYPTHLRKKTPLDLWFDSIRPADVRPIRRESCGPICRHGIPFYDAARDVWPCALCFARTEPGTLKAYPKQREFTSLIPDKKLSSYNPDLLQIAGYGTYSVDRHGLTAWIERKKPVGNAPHPEEAEERKKLRLVKVRGNTGGLRPLRAGEDFLKWTIDDREAVEKLPQEESLQLRNDYEVERQLTKDSKPDVFFDGEEFQLLENREYHPGFRVEKRGLTPAEQEEWDDLDQLAEDFKSGQCWSPTDPPEFTREHNGVRYNQMNERYRQIAYKYNIVARDYDSKKQLATELGLSPYQVRKETMATPKDCPTTKLTPELIKRVEETNGRIVLAHVVTGGRAQWFELDMRDCDTYQEALDALCYVGIHRVMDDWRAKRPSKNAFNAKLKETTARWTKWFRRENVYILDTRMPMAVAITQEAEEAKKPVSLVTT